MIASKSFGSRFARCRATLAALTPLSGLTRVSPLLDLAQPTVRNALLILLGLTYLLNTAALSAAALRTARRRREEARGQG